MKKEYKKLLTNTGLLAIGNFSSSLLGMLLIPFYTMVLSTTDYGISDLIITTTALLYPFTSVAISESIMRFSLDKSSDKRSVYSIGLSVVLCGYLIVLAGYPIIKNSAIGEYSAYFYLYYLFFCLHTITSYFVKGLEKVAVYSASGLLNSVIVISSNLLFLLLFKWGIKGYLISSILGHALTFAFMFFSCKLYNYIILPYRINRSLFRNMIKYSLPIIPNSISWWVANSSDKYILNYFADVSEVGVYSVSYKIPTILMTVMGIFISAWQLSAVEDFGSEKSKKFFSNIYDKSFSVSIILSTVLIITARPLAAILYSNDFFAAWKYVPILIAANVFNMLASFLGTVYTSAKKTKMLAISTVIGAMTNIVMNFVLIPWYGAFGAAVATAISYFVMYLIRIINTRKLLPFYINYRINIIAFVLLLLQICLVIYNSLISVAISILIFIAILVIFRNSLSEIFGLIFNFAKKFLKHKEK